MIYLSAIVDARALLETVDAERCEGVYCLPTVFIVVTHHDFAQFVAAHWATGIMAVLPYPIAVRGP